MPQGPTLRDAQIRTREREIGDTEVNIEPNEVYVDEHDVLFVWGAALIVAVLALLGVLFSVRLYNKSGADIQNPIELRRLAVAQERIAAALERK